ncbi:DNA recombination protein RmuC [Flavobacteriales bacterium]|nr:DNA recombination protein RmuC [Flavobacteriales bacterium]
MNTDNIILVALAPLFFAIGWAVARILGRERQARQLAVVRADKDAEIAELQIQLGRMEAVEIGKEEAVEAYKETLLDSFKSAAGDALQQNNEQFLKLAETTLGEKITSSKGELDQRKTAIEELLKPMKSALEQYTKRINSLEKDNSETFGQVMQLMMDVKSSNSVLQKETTALVNALRNPRVRGKWGEIGLKRVVEFSGMSPHCDFSEQVHAETEGGAIKPDLVVNLPGGGQIVVDSKLPLDAYLSALESEVDSQREGLLVRHAADVRKHVTTLSRKSYWAQFDNAPDFVVLYMQVESALSTAMVTDPKLLQDAMDNKIIIATPTTLLAVLKSVALSWQQHSVTENAQKIIAAGKELHSRIAVFAGHLAKVGSGLKSATNSYNSAVGSWERRIRPSGRKLEQLSNTERGPLNELDCLESPVQTDELE